MQPPSKTIVWIDDDIDIIDPVILPLVRAGYRIIRLYTVSDALDALDEIRNADLVLLAMTIPPGSAASETPLDFPLSGMQLLYDLRNRYEVHTPVAVFTIVDSPELARQLNQIGIDEMIHKPIRPTELKVQVEKILLQHTPGRNRA